MSNKTISQALKDVFLGLGGNPSELSDNQTASDYIEDLESAIKGAASGAGAFVLTLNESSSHVISSVETWTEIKAAVSEGKNIIVKLNDYTLGHPVYYYGAEIMLDETVGGNESQLILKTYYYDRDEGGVVFKELSTYESDAVDDKIANAFFNQYVCATINN